VNILKITEGGGREGEKKEERVGGRKAGRRENTSC
jgi:hypothetical protein